MRPYFEWHGLWLICALVAAGLMETFTEWSGVRFFVGWVWGSCISLIVVWLVRLWLKKGEK